MRIAVVACLLAAVALAQPDPFAGVFQGDKVVLELKAVGGKYAGTVTVQGQTFPVSATAVGKAAEGVFTVAGRNYPFRLAPYGNGFKLTSEGAEYLLVRRVEAAAAPAPAPRAAPAAPQPP